MIHGDWSLEQVTCKFVTFGEAMHTKKTGKLVYRERMKDTASGQERIKQEPCNTREKLPEGSQLWRSRPK